MRSTNSVSSKLLQLARVAFLAWFAAYCAVWKSESLSQDLGLSKPVWSVDFWTSLHQVLGDFPVETAVDYHSSRK